MKEVYQKSLNEIFSELKTSKDGLTTNQAQLKLKEYGKNTFQKKKKLNSVKIFFSQFNSFLIYILIFASLISFFIGHIIDGGVILAIVFLNAIIGFIQQFKAEKAIQSLKKMIIANSKIIRDGKVSLIPSIELVPGDIVLLESGNKINADMRIIESENVKVNEAVLTGESESVGKIKTILSKKTSINSQRNMLFQGTSIVAGSAKAVVVRTGHKTSFGKIAESLEEIKSPKTPWEEKLDKFSKQTGIIILGMVSLIALLGLTDNFDLIETFFIAVALAVSAIPEGLPAVLVVGFAISSRLMSKKKVIIRKLPAVEGLGSVTVICTDKTGTLTEEKMTVQKFFVNNKILTKTKIKSLSKELKKLIEISILCNNARYEKTKNKISFIGDPTENALIEAAIDFKIDKKTLIEKNSSIKKFEFDSKRKLMSVLRKSGNLQTLYTKGAIRKVISLSKYELINGKTKSLTIKRKKEILAEAAKLENEALRLLGFGYKKISTQKDINEKDLVFVGFCGMIDPPRKEVKKAIEECRSAGIKIKMITGDSLITAKAIAKKIGIEGKAIDEAGLRRMSDSKLKKSINEIAIFARMTPEQKLRVLKMLQNNGETVAMTGDGVNDVLALRQADIGVAMGIRGSDVSREVADIVLIDDNFASIVEGVKEGRKTYDNIKKFTKYLLAVNFSEIFLVMFSLIFCLPLPLLPIQILWMNLVSDSFPSLTLIFEKEENVMNTKPRKEKNLLSSIWKFLIVAGIFAFIIELIVYLISIGRGDSIELTRSLILSTAILYELLFVYTCRSNFPLKKIGILSNKWLNLAIVGSFAIHLILIYTPLGRFFDLVPLTLENWLFILPFAFSGLIVFEIAKLFKNKVRTGF